MRINKKDLAKYEVFKRLLDRWPTIPRNVLAELADAYEVDENLLNNIRADKLKQHINKLKREQGND